MDAGIVVSARIEPEGQLLVISHPPPDSSPEQVEESILRLLHGPSRSGRRSGIGTGIRGVRNETTSRTGTRVVVELRVPAADVEGVTAALVELWPIRRSIAARLEQPLAALIRQAASDRVGLDERLAMIEQGTRSDWRRPRESCQVRGRNAVLP
ncbi:MAG: hypothetical protein ACK5OX_13695 [Desertimonas sp.]